MNSTDLVTMLGNLSQSLVPVQALITGFAYLLGILFIISAVTKLKSLGSPSSHESKYGAVMSFIAGAFLIFLPSAVHVLSNTAFGVGNILQYSSYSSYNIYNSMGVVIQTAGVIWFVRGCVLMVHSGEPGAKIGAKGITFTVAGILAINFNNTVGFFNYVMNSFLTLTGFGGTQ